jgi:hypothetical protein
MRGNEFATETVHSKIRALHSKRRAMGNAIPQWENATTDTETARA